MKCKAGSNYYGTNFTEFSNSFHRLNPTPPYPYNSFINTLIPPFPISFIFLLFLYPHFPNFNRHHNITNKNITQMAFAKTQVLFIVSLLVATCMAQAPSPTPVATPAPSPKPAAPVPNPVVPPTLAPVATPVPAPVATPTVSPVSPPTAAGPAADSPSVPSTLGPVSGPVSGPAAGPAADITPGNGAGRSVAAGALLFGGFVAALMV